MDKVDLGQATPMGVHIVFEVPQEATSKSTAIMKCQQEQFPYMIKYMIPDPKGSTCKVVSLALGEPKEFLHTGRVPQCLCDSILEFWLFEVV